VYYVLMKIFRYLFIIALLIFTFLNLKITAENISQRNKSLSSSDDFPGSRFLFLKPFLAHVDRAGYYTDYAPSDPDLDPVYAYHFQTALFALAPTLLDHKKPWDYEFVIVHLSHQELMADVLKRWPSRVIVSNGANIVLIRRLSL